MMKKIAGRGFLLATLIGVFACATPLQKGEVADSAKTVRNEPVAKKSVVFTGKIVGYDGTPLQAGYVMISLLGMMEKSFYEAPLAPDGTFRAESRFGGHVRVSISGVNHAQFTLHPIVKDQLRLDVRLGTLSYPDWGDTLRVRAEFLLRDDKCTPADVGEAKRISNHSYRFKIPPTPKGAIALRYQIVFPSGQTVNGPTADRYEYDGKGDYFSIINLTTDRDEVVLNFNDAPLEVHEPEVKMEGADSHYERVQEWTKRWQKKLIAIMHETQHNEKQTSVFIAERQRELARQAQIEIEGIESETEQIWFRVLFSDMFFPYRTFEERRDDAYWLMRHVPPEHPALLMNPGGSLLRLLRDDGLVGKDALTQNSNLSADVEKFLEEVSRHSPYLTIAADATLALLYIAREKGDKQREQKLYNRISSPAFNRTNAAYYARQKFDPNRILQRDHPFPDFDFASLDNPNQRIRKVDFEDQIFLVAFWATWCGPCITEMEKLHEVYAKLNHIQTRKTKRSLQKLRHPKSQRVPFVFVSMDQDPQVVRKFRKEKWSMPWVHAYSPMDTQKDVFDTYGFSSLPTLVLVGVNGKILAVQQDILHIPDLISMVEAALVEKTIPSSQNSSD